MDFQILSYNKFKCPPNVFIDNHGYLKNTTHVSFDPSICFREKLLVTPYGFDDTVWDPSKDKFLPAKYSAENINGKAVCKAALRKHLGFSGNVSTIVVSDALRCYFSIM